MWKNLLMILVPLGLLASKAAINLNELQPIGGHWLVSGGDSAVYFYRDGEKTLDLFSYHASDSNEDDIANVQISHDEQFLLIDSQGYPNHPTALFPNSWNPNSIEVQDFHFRLPLKPKLNDKITRLPMGPIGVALNGVVFFNPFEVGGMNAVEGYSEVWLDSCCGHPQQKGVYHYHKYPTCVKSPFVDDGKQHSPIIGFAFDGFPIYGPYESEGVMAKDLDDRQALDVCNGHSDKLRGYHYHVTPGKFPYIIGGYAGVPERSNSRMLRSMRTGAIQDNAEGKSERIGQVIMSVKPGSIERGKTHTIRFSLNPTASTRDRIPESNPDWIQIGPFEAKNIERSEDIVTAEFQIPEDASLNILLDCHLEFGRSGSRGRTLVFKKNNVLRVIE